MLVFVLARCQTIFEKVFFSDHHLQSDIFLFAISWILLLLIAVFLHPYNFLNTYQSENSETSLTPKWLIFTTKSFSVPKISSVIQSFIGLSNNINTFLMVPCLSNRGWKVDASYWRTNQVNNQYTPYQYSHQLSQPLVTSHLYTLERSDFYLFYVSGCALLYV